MSCEVNRCAGANNAAGVERDNTRCFGRLPNRALGRLGPRTTRSTTVPRQDFCGRADSRQAHCLRATGGVIRDVQRRGAGPRCRGFEGNTDAAARAC